MNEQREAIAKTIHDAWNLSGVPYERANLFKASKFEAQADAVIAHLWREAMKPEVISAMAKALWVADDKPGVGHGSDGYRMEAEHHIRLVLNLIIGPNPNEQENSDVDRQ